VSDGSIASGVNAALLGGGQITGAATDSSTHLGIPGVLVIAFAPGDDIATSDTCTASDGTYTLRGFSSGSYVVQFDTADSEQGCGSGPAADYFGQYYDNASSPGTATPVQADAGSTTPDVNAVLTLAGGGGNGTGGGSAGGGGSSGTGGSPGPGQSGGTGSAPNCSVAAASRAVLLKSNKKALRSRVGRLFLSYRCAASVRPTLSAHLTITIRKLHGRSKLSRFSLGPIPASPAGSRTGTFAVRLPAAVITALRGHARVSAVLEVVVNGESLPASATVRVGQLHGVG
jgi:hypothetical protein